MVGEDTLVSLENINSWNWKRITKTKTENER